MTPTAAARADAVTAIRNLLHESKELTRELAFQVGPSGSCRAADELWDALELQRKALMALLAAQSHIVNT